MPQGQSAANRPTLTCGTPSFRRSHTSPGRLARTLQSGQTTRCIAKRRSPPRKPCLRGGLQDLHVPWYGPELWLRAMHPTMDHQRRRVCGNWTFTPPPPHRPAEVGPRKMKGFQ